MKKTVLLIFSMVICATIVYAQECYSPKLEIGKKLYSQKKYQEAKKAFIFAGQCDDKPGGNEELNEWINKCNTALQNQPAQTTKTPDFLKKYDQSWDQGNGLYLVFKGEKKIDAGSECVDFSSFGLVCIKFAKIEFNGKFGMVDDGGIEIVSCKYTNAGHFQEGMAMVTLNNKYGYIDESGNEVIPLIYNNVKSFSEGLAAVENENNKWGFINKNGRIIIAPKYDEVEKFENGAAKVFIGQKVKKESILVSSRYEYIGKWGLIDKNGRETVPCKYNEMEDFSEGLASVKNSNEKWGFINRHGEEVVACKYDAVENLSNGLAKVFIGKTIVEKTESGGTRSYKEGKWGLINETGNEVLPCIYDYINSFCPNTTSIAGLGGIGKNEDNDCISDLIMVGKDSKYGIANNNGKLVLPCEYEYFNTDFYNYRLAINKKRVQNTPSRFGYQYGYINTSGNIVIPLIYGSATDFSDGWAAVQDDNGIRYIDVNGNVVLRLSRDYDDAESFYDGLAKVAREVGDDYKYGYINKSGKEVIPCKFDDAENFHNGLAPVANNKDKLGFIDKTGRLVVNYKYDEVDFDEELGKFRIVLNEKEGLLDNSGKELIPCTYEKYDIQLLSDGFFWVSKNGKEGLIDQNGKLIVPFQYDNVEEFNEYGLAEVSKKSTGGDKNKSLVYGFIDKSGKEVIPCRYDYADDFLDGKVRMILNNREFVFDTNGKETTW